MQADIAASAEYIQALEQRHVELLGQQSVLDAQLDSIHFFLLEQRAVLCSNGAAAAATVDSPALEMSRMLAEARFEDLVFSTPAGQFLFPPTASATTASAAESAVVARAHEMIATWEFGSHLVLFAGAACLQMYIQANWTGPPVQSLSNPDRYPLPGFPRESELDPHPQLLAKLEYYAKSSSAATGKDKAVGEVDPFPLANNWFAGKLEINGEQIFDTQVVGVHLLYVAKLLLVDVLGGGGPVTTGWWSARLATAWQESLNTREVASNLKLQCQAGFDSTSLRLSQFPVAVSGTTLGLLSMERGVAMHKFQDPTQAKRWFRQAMVNDLQLQVELSGALGKRTKFQVESKSQLILVTKSTDPNRSNTSASSVTPIQSQTVAPQTEGEVSGFGTILEAGHVRVAIQEVDVDTPLHERIEFEREERATGEMRLIDQVLVLNLCIDVKNSAAMELLTSEQMLAYVDLVMLRPENFSIHACALLIKSKLEFEKYKTKERSVLQMQLLVDQQSNRLTPLQPSINNGEENRPLERLEYIHALVWPPVWRLKRSLADRYQSVGVNMSALQLYQELHIWDDAVAVLLRMEKRHRAEQLIREQPHLTPNLLVILGELLEDETMMERAWTESNGRFARAQRVLGARAFARNEFPKAKAHFQLALGINAHFPSVWFKLGLISFREKDYGQARVAYAELVRIEPEDSEAWANLSACMYAQNELDSALNASVEATKHARGNAKLWHNQLTLAIQLAKLDLALECVNELIDLEGRNSGAPQVEVNALLALTEHAIARPGFRHRYDALVAKIKAKCTSQADVWMLVSEYYTATEQWALKEDALLRRCRCFLATPEWTKQDNIIRRLVLTSIALCQNAVAHSDRGARENIYNFVRGFLSKIPTEMDKLGALTEVWNELNTN
ncbi:hypothetical protein BASA81_010265 [Batrachochytrium salamandrivorans]|nr:hypothetical protein BASA81_010265 [Batrachochytrium salamandrivorans]